jgi:hypothetical protein
MSRSISCLVASIFTIFLTTHAFGQIDYEEIPDPPVNRNEIIVHRYETSWGTRDDPVHIKMGPGGPFKTKEAAEDSLKRKFAETKGNGSLSVTHGLITRRPYVKSASGDESEPVDSAESDMSRSRSPTSRPDLKIVDPGPSSSSKKQIDPKNLIGEKFAGTVGKTEVLFDFRSDRLVTISTSIVTANPTTISITKRSLDASWMVDKDGQLLISAFNADFVGTVNGNTIAGIRTTKDKTDKRAWSLKLDDQPVEIGKGSAYNDPRMSKAQSPAPQGKAYNDDNAPKGAKSKGSYWIEMRWFTIDGKWTEWGVQDRRFYSGNASGPYESEADARNVLQKIEQQPLLEGHHKARELRVR